MRTDRRRLQADADGRAQSVQARIVEGGGDEVFHAAAGRHALDQRAHQRARQRGVAVREVVDVGGLVLSVAARLVLDPQRLGARKTLAHGIERADGVDAVAEVVARTALEEVGGVGRQLADVGEERAVAGLGKGRDFLLRRCPAM